MNLILARRIAAPSTPDVYAVDPFVSNHRIGMVELRSVLRDVFRPVYRPARRTVRFARWAVPAFANLLAGPAATDKRVLVTYDTSTQPFSVGDFLILQEGSLALCKKHGLTEVDVAIIYDPQNPASSDPVFASYVTDENVFHHLASILPIAQVNPKLGSVLVFNSHRHFERFANDNLDRYLVWPSGWHMATRENLSPVVFHDLIGDHHAANRTLPHLSCRPYLKRWAEAFHAVHACGRVPVTVNLRNNPGWSQHRNSNFDAWIAFFEHCAGRYPVTFVILCARSEIDARLRLCSNVIIAKDHDTGVEQDLALIHTSAMHMGANSGPATMAWFNDKPYLMVNTSLRSGTGALLWGPGTVLDVAPGKQRVWFSAPLQHTVSGVESKELLVREFELMWAAINVRQWQSAPPVLPDDKAKLQSWLR